MKQKKPKWRSRVLSAAEVSVTRECQYVAGLAEQRDARVVALGRLILFSTETGDAWMLDPSGNLAVCLAREGSAVSAQVHETKRRASVHWTHTYRLHEGCMTFVDAQSQTTTARDYPTREIDQAIRRADRRCR